MSKARVEFWFLLLKMGLALGVVFTIAALVDLVVNHPRPPTGEQVRQFAQELGCTERNKFVADIYDNRLPDELIFECNHVLVTDFYMRLLIMRKDDEKWKLLINELRK